MSNTETQTPAEKLAREYRPTMPPDVLHLWAADVVAELRRLDTQNKALRAALDDAKGAINSMKVEAETAAQGDEQMMLEACEQISNEGLQASMGIDAALRAKESP